MAIMQTERAVLPVGSGANAMNAVDWIAMALLIVGGVNWGLVGLFGFDLVAAIFGDMTAPARIVYSLVGLSALWCLFTATKLAARRGV